MSSPKRKFKIYALYQPEKRLAFLGKSYANDLRPIYSKHVCGRNRYTRDYFGKSPPLVTPAFCVLDTVEETYRMAYKYLVAWCRMFLDNGFTLILQQGTVEYAQALHEDTAAIYAHIRKTPLETILQQNQHVPLFEEHTEVLPSNQDQEPHKEATQLNLRVFREDALHFSALCEHEGITRKQGFALLLRCCPYSDDPSAYSDELNLLLKKQLALTSTALEATQTKLENLLSSSNQSSSRHKIFRETAKEFLRRYLAVTRDSLQCPPMPKLKAKRYRSFPDVSRYQYPSEDHGIQIVMLNGFAWSKGRRAALFIFALSEDLTPIKLRSYPNQAEYLGNYIYGSKWSYSGARWLVAWRRSADGACGLVGSIPLPYTDTPTPGIQTPSEPFSNTFDSLDEIIRKAKR